MSEIKNMREKAEDGLYRSTYRDAFEQVKMGSEAREKVLSIAAEGERKRSFHGRRRFSMAIAVCMAVVLITGTALAVTAGGGLKSWFSDEWGYNNDGEMPVEQQQIVERLTIPVGISQTVGHLTVTVDSVAYSDGYYWLMVNAEGMKFDEDNGYSCRHSDLRIISEDGRELAQCGSSITQTARGGSALKMLFEGEISPESAEAIALDGNMRFMLSVSDFVEKKQGIGASTKESVLQEGTWSFRFEVPVNESGEILAAPDANAVFTIENGEETVCRVSKIQINMVGIKYLFEGESEAHGELPRLIFKDGGEVGITGGSGVQLEDGSWQMKYQWSMPVDLSQVEKVKFGKTVVEVE
ncbi:MAG: hypothetical protein ACI4LP_03625 [Anaerovoracaceae bacterium]